MARGARGQAKGKGRGKGRGKGESRGPHTLKQRAGQKIRENMPGLADPQIFVAVYPPSGLTMEEQVMAHLKAKDAGDVTVTFGKWYYAELRNRYAAKDYVFVSLSPGADDTSIVSPQLCQACRFIYHVVKVVFKVFKKIIF